MGFVSQKLLEPGALTVGEDRAAWKAKDLNHCILGGDPECALHIGASLDKPIVGSTKWNFFTGLRSQ